MNPSKHETSLPAPPSPFRRGARLARWRSRSPSPTLPPVSRPPHFTTRSRARMRRWVISTRPSFGAKGSGRGRAPRRSITPKRRGVSTGPGESIEACAHNIILQHDELFDMSSSVRDCRSCVAGCPLACTGGCTHVLCMGGCLSPEQTFILYNGFWEWANERRRKINEDVVERRWTARR